MLVLLHNRRSALAALLLGSALVLEATSAGAQPEPPPAEGKAPAARPGGRGAAAPKVPRGKAGAKTPPAESPAEPGTPAAPPASGGGAEPGAGDAPGAPPSTGQPASPPGAAPADAPLLGEGGPPPKDATAAAGAAPKAPAAGEASAKVAAPATAKGPPPAAEPTAAPTGEPDERPSEVYAEDWWSTARPVLELHGYYRARAEFMHNFALNRRDTQPLWAQPADQQYVDSAGTLHRVSLCGDDPLNLESCDSNTNMGANMRFRLTPALHVSDNLRVMAQIDMLDNLVAGSTPEGYASSPSADGGYTVAARGGYAPIGALSSTQWAPQAGVNSTSDSILVKRAWGEYSTPIGEVRFGRMPSHWGLGIFQNAGDGFDSDYQSTVDALQIITGIKSWDLYFSFRLDFANEGSTTATFLEQQGQAVDAAQRDDVDQYVFMLFRRQNAALARKDLADGLPVFNGGAYFAYRRQDLANDATGTTDTAAVGANNSTIGQGYVRRGFEAFIPDLWFQFMYEKFRLELEGIMVWGSIENTQTVGSNYENSLDSSNPGWKIRQFGIASEAQYTAVEDRLRVGLKFAWASGDADVESLAATGTGLQPQLTTDRTFSTFRFHPDYRVDLILFRNILTRVEGAYFFRPSVEYDFFRDPDGQKVGGGAALIWSRASEFVQTPGHARDLGVELNFKLYYQARDGVLNDDAEKMGGFFTQLEYGVLFPLDGLGYLPGQQDDYAAYTPGEEPIDTETAQTVRWYLGVLF